MLRLLPLALSLAWPAAALPPQSAQAPRPVQAQDPDAAYYFLLARSLETAGKADEALTAINKAIALDPQSAELHAELAELYARQDKAPESLQAAEAALKLDSRNQEANRILGSVLAALIDQHLPARPGDDVTTYPKRAIAALEIARGDGTGDLSIDLALARLYLDGNRSADAIPLLRRIVDEQPQYAEGSLLLADAEESANQPEAAAATLKGLLEHQPQFFRAQVQLAELYEHQRQWGDAADAWARAQSMSAGNKEIAPRRATALINAGRAKEAIEVLHAGLSRQAGDLRMSFELAQAQHDAGDLDAAEATARDLHAAHPEDPRATYLLAQMLEAKDKYQDVVDLLTPEIAKLRQAGGKGPQVAMLLGSEGLALQQLHKNDQAIAAFKDAVTVSPDEPVRYVLLSQGYLTTGRTREAIDTAEAARTKFPDDSQVLYALGSAYDRAGRETEAEKTFRDLIARDPLDANSLNYLGYMLAEHHSSLDEAVTLIERALTVEPGNPSYLDSLGFAYFQQGRVDLADSPLSTAAEKEPKNSVIQDHLGDLRLKQNRPTDAIAAWQRALAGDGDSVDRSKIQKKIDAARKGK